MCVTCDSYTCLTCLIHMCDDTCSYVSRDSFVCVTWHICICWCSRIPLPPHSLQQCHLAVRCTVLLQCVAVCCSLCLVKSLLSAVGNARTPPLPHSLLMLQCHWCLQRQRVASSRTFTHYLSNEATSVSTASQTLERLRPYSSHHTPINTTRFTVHTHTTPTLCW